VRDVDDFLVAVERALRRSERLDGRQIRTRRFHASSRFHPGYIQQDVHEMLDEIARYAEVGACDLAQMSCRVGPGLAA
jgi:hypothetical protein